MEFLQVIQMIQGISWRLENDDPITFYLGSLRSVNDGIDSLFDTLIRFAHAVRDVVELRDP